MKITISAHQAREAAHTLRLYVQNADDNGISSTLCGNLATVATALERAALIHIAPTAEAARQSNDHNRHKRGL